MNNNEPREGDGISLPSPHIPPWEDRGHHSLVGGFFETVRQVVVEPGRFFTGHPTRRGWLMPTLFAVSMGVLQNLWDWVWSRAFHDEGRRFIEIMESWTGESPDPSLDPVLMERLSLLFSPVSTLIGLFILVGMIHLGLRMLADEPKGFEATLRAVAYAHGALIFSVVPGFGNAIALFWGVPVTVIAIHKLHHVRVLHAMAAVLVPPILAFGAMVAC